MILMAQDVQTLLLQAQVTVFLLKDLGFVINQAKSDLIPKTRMEFLGFSIDSI